MLEDGEGPCCACTDRFRLLVHDAGGPVGFEVAAAQADRIQSLTMLNTFVEPAEWKRPWFLKPFVAPGLGELAARLTPSLVFARLMHYVGIQDPRAISRAEIDAHLELIRRDDCGRAMLRIVRHAVTDSASNVEKAALYKRVLRDGRYRVQITWGANDPAVPLIPYGEMARRNAGLQEIITLPAEYFARGGPGCCDRRLRRRDRDDGVSSASGLTCRVRSLGGKRRLQLRQ